MEDEGHRKTFSMPVGRLMMLGKTEFNRTTGIIRRLNCYLSNNSLLSVNTNKSRGFAFMDLKRDKWLVIAALSPCQGEHCETQSFRSAEDLNVFGSARLDLETRRRL